MTVKVNSLTIAIVVDIYGFEFWNTTVFLKCTNKTETNVCYYSLA